MHKNLFFGYSRRDGVTSILFNLGLPSFDTLMKNASVSYSRLQNCCSNRLVVHVSAICVLTVITVVQLITLNFLSVCFLIYIRFLNIFSVIVLYVCLSVMFCGPRCLKLKLVMMMMMMMMMMISLCQAQPH